MISKLKLKTLMLQPEKVINPIFLAEHERNEYESMALNGFRYDFKNQLIIVDHIISKIPVKGKAILETGFGDGVVLAVLSKIGARCYGVDISKGRFKKAELLFKLMNVKPMVKYCTMTDISYEDSTFDLVIAISTLEHVAQRGIQPEIFTVPKNSDNVLLEKAVKEIARVLKPGGNALIQIPNGRSILQLIVESHHKLPFLPIMPRWLAVWYVTKITKKDPFYQVGSYIGYNRITALFNKYNLNMANISINPERCEVLEKMNNPKLYKLRIFQLIAFICKVTGITSEIIRPIIYSNFYLKYISYVYTFWLTKKSA